jgi:hypothetical protein
VRQGRLAAAAPVAPVDGGQGPCAGAQRRGEAVGSDRRARHGRARLRGSCQDARELVKRRDFRQLEVGIGWLLEQGHEVGPDLLVRVQEITRQETKTVPASAKEGKHAGLFAAIADLDDPSRKDRFAKGAFDRTIKRWQEGGEQIPLCWLETPSFPYLIGSVDPATFRVEDGFGPLFGGSIDLEGDHPAEARHGWTAVKSNGVDLQLEYMLLANDEADGRRTLREVDVTGLALAPTPEGRKAIDRERREGLRELRREWDRLRFELAVGDLDLDAIEAAREPEPAGPTMGELRQQAKTLGIPVPPPRPGTAEAFRDEMFRLVTSNR